jgi:hypothetical protein
VASTQFIASLKFIRFFQYHGERVIFSTVSACGIIASRLTTSRRASVVRTQWRETVRRFFERYDHFVAPTAQVFPFDVDQHWPRAIAGRSMHLSSTI